MGVGTNCRVAVVRFNQSACLVTLLHFQLAHQAHIIPGQYPPHFRRNAPIASAAYCCSAQSPFRRPPVPRRPPEGFSRPLVSLRDRCAPPAAPPSTPRQFAAVTYTGMSAHGSAGPHTRHVCRGVCRCLLSGWCPTQRGWWLAHWRILSALGLRLGCSVVGGKAGTSPGH